MNAFQSFGIALCACILFAAPTGAAQSDGIDRLLNSSRAALGGGALAHAGVIQIDVKLSTSGLSGAGSAWQEIGGVHFAEKSLVAPIQSADGFDGKNFWNQDGSGLVWIDGGGLGRAQEISSAFASDYALWGPKRNGASVNWGGVRTDAGKSFDALIVKAPGSALPFELWFDRATHLPVRLVQSAGPLVATIKYSDYRPVAGVMIPFRVHQETSDGNSTDSTVTRALANAPGARAHLIKPVSNVHDFSIAGGASQTSVPFDLVDDHVYMTVMLNGKGPYRFIYDTGGLNVVDPEVAKEIGAAGHGVVQGSGVGSETESLSFAKVDALSFGEATVRDQVFAIAPTRQGFGISGGRPVDGLIGFEVLARFVSTFDYGSSRVIFQMPGTAGAASGADIVPFFLDGKQPEFGCTIESIATLCSLDTGSRGSITLMTPFLKDHPQVVPAAVTADGVNGFGLGGPSLGRLGRLQTLGFGAFKIHNVIADFTTQEKGSLAAPFIGGNVGGGILKRFSLTLDYQAQKMILVPNAAYASEDTYERSGLFIVNKGGKKVVLDARPGTPAAQAGIVKGDTIESIDGKSVADLSLQDVRALFFGPPGTVLHFTLTGKDGAAKTATVTLANFI